MGQLSVTRLVIGLLLGSAILAGCGSSEASGEPVTAANSVNAGTAGASKPIDHMPESARSAMQAGGGPAAGANAPASGTNGG